MLLYLQTQLFVSLNFGIFQSLRRLSGKNVKKYSIFLWVFSPGSWVNEEVSTSKTAVWPMERRILQYK